MIRNPSDFQTFTDDRRRLAHPGSPGAGWGPSSWSRPGISPGFSVRGLEQQGFEVHGGLATTRSACPGRKTDVSDAEWLQRLCMNMACCAPSFRPQAEIAWSALRLPSAGGSGCRLRGGACSAHAEGADTNEPAATSCHLGHHRRDRYGDRSRDRGRRARSDRPGLTSDRRCHASVETVCQALIGNHREEHVFALIQALELYDVYQTKVMACDKQIEAILTRLRQAAPRPC